MTERERLGERIRGLRARARGRRLNPGEDTEAAEHDEFRELAAVLTIAELKALQAISEAAETRTERPPETPPVQLFAAEGRAWVGRAWPLGEGLHVIEIAARGDPGEEAPEDGAA
ncbi:MAG: hypothetical protein OXH14_17035 [Alphaproteobacteria bacterium]|nr:hypothetical protein [Alphaproteobacteria bacterium]